MPSLRSDNPNIAHQSNEPWISRLRPGVRWQAERDTAFIWRSSFVVSNHRRKNLCRSTILSSFSHLHSSPPKLIFIKAMVNFVTRTVIIASAGLVMLGCSRGSALSPGAASQLAAKLANEQCDHLYQQHPFSAAQHSIVLHSGKYEWGAGFDPVGPGGFSALVSFRIDGSAPHVEVYFSCDPPFMTSPPSSLPLFYHDNASGAFQQIPSFVPKP
jgi:hypothetical protein